METGQAVARCRLTFADEPDACATAVTWHTWDGLVEGQAHVLVDGEERCEYVSPVKLRVTSLILCENDSLSR